MAHPFYNWLRATWDSLRTSLWLLPAVMFLLGIALATVALRIGPTEAGWLGVGSGEDARNLLSTLLTAVIGMASIVFSITVVSLSLAANSYGPRLIRTFRASRNTQIVIGTFMLTIVYLLLVLRALRGSADPTEVPDVAVTGGMVMALVSVLGLLAFIHGVATLMVADEVVRRVRREFDAGIRKLPHYGEHRSTADLPSDFSERAVSIPLPREGYVQSVDYESLVAWAEQHDAIVKLDFRPGDFVVEGDHKVAIYPPPANSSEARRQIDRLIVSGHQRTPTQDLEYATRHLVEVAVRALSPGINDPFTALAVIDRLRGGLVRLCRRDLPSNIMFDGAGKLRIWRDAVTFPGMVDQAFRQIRQAGSSKPDVLVHMLQAIAAIGEHVRSEEQRDAFSRHVMLIRNEGRRGLGEPQDVADVEREAHVAMSSLSGRTAQLE